jgi:hypothetical protein
MDSNTQIYILFGVFGFVAALLIFGMFVMLRRTCFKDCSDRDCGIEICGTLHGGWFRDPEKKSVNSSSNTLSWDNKDETIDARKLNEEINTVKKKNNLVILNFEKNDENSKKSKSKKKQKKAKEPIVQNEKKPLVQTNSWMYQDNTIDVRNSLDLKKTNEIENLDKVRPVLPNRGYLSYTSIQKSVKNSLYDGEVESLEPNFQNL